ncbi:hypothetical protein GIB67_029102 [Kingdonia uniflora]|uniref:Protein kinase domain-containing protein n=1 Tax=Kingdonia uniflora TaxID=39325 RepID=A0A7J7N6W9_9MAGN|nr:hypothetical protein GIB67_029102 [Kingdonia uniflora]
MMGHGQSGQGGGPFRPPPNLWFYSLEICDKTTPSMALIHLPRLHAGFIYLVVILASVIFIGISLENEFGPLCLVFISPSLILPSNAYFSLARKADPFAHHDSYLDRGYDITGNEVEKKIMEASFDANVLKLNDDGGITAKLAETDLSATFEDDGFSVKCLSFLPDLIASVKRVALEGTEDVKSKVEGNVDGECIQELDTANTHTDVEVDSDNDYPVISKIEPTKAEAEALSRGLQTTTNEDLEEIREMGTGTYGDVYYRKWKGSDVAIKRIKASCFAGRPSERERLDQIDAGEEDLIVLFGPKRSGRDLASYQ